MWFLSIANWFFKNPLGQKVGLVVVCAIAAIIALNWYGNNQYEKGKQTGVFLGAEDARKSMEEKWKEMEASLAATQEQLTQSRATIEKNNLELQELRSSLNSALKQIATTSQHSMEVASTEVAALPSPVLDDAIRNKSKELQDPTIQPSAELQENKLLDDPEKRVVLLQLYELQTSRVKISQLEDWITKEQQLVEKEKDNSSQALDNEKKQTELVKQELDLAKQQVKFYQDLYTSVTKHRGCGVGGTILRILTLGFHRCK